MPKLTFLILVALAISACEKSREFLSYEEFISAINNDYSLASSAYGELSEREKVEVYLGANELHPPDTRIADLAFDEDFAFIFTLRDEVERKDNYIATFDYVNEIKRLIRTGRVSPDEAEKLSLDDLCRSLTNQSDACLEILKAP